MVSCFISLVFPQHPSCPKSFHTLLGISLITQWHEVGTSIGGVTSDTSHLVPPQPTATAQAKIWLVPNSSLVSKCGDCAGPQPNLDLRPLLTEGHLYLSGKETCPTRNQFRGSGGLAQLF